MKEMENMYSWRRMICVALLENWANAKQKAAMNTKKSSIKPITGPSKSMGMMRYAMARIMNMADSHFIDVFWFLIVVSMACAIFHLFHSTLVGSKPSQSRWGVLFLRSISLCRGPLVCCRLICLQGCGRTPSRILLLFC